MTEERQQELDDEIDIDDFGYGDPKEHNSEYMDNDDSDGSVDRSSITMNPMRLSGSTNTNTDTDNTGG